jgi:tRNA(Arg) A34 adenosine deaminase TadA
MFDLQQLSNIARKLKADNIGNEVAVVEDSKTPGTVHYALRAPRTKEPYSAAVRLIQIGKLQKLQFQKPMVSTAPLTAMCEGMSGVAKAGLAEATPATATAVILPGTPATPGAIVVNALQLVDANNWEEREDDLKLFSVPDIVSPNVNILSDIRTNDHQGLHTVHRIYMMAAYALLSSRVIKQSANLPGGKNIGVLMVSPQGQIIGYGVNTNTANGTFHAEVNCLQSYYKFNKKGYAGIPLDTRIYSTLQPCEMCAGMIWEAAVEPTSLLVYYGMIDPGQLKGGTKLSKMRRERLLSQWQEVSYYGTDNVKREVKGDKDPKNGLGPKAIKIYEEREGPNAYKVTYSDYAEHLENKIATLRREPNPPSAADFMTGTKKDKSVPSTILNVNISLLRKSNKYTVNPDKKALNPNVKKVVAHVHAFLLQKGIVLT